MICIYVRSRNSVSSSKVLRAQKKKQTVTVILCIFGIALFRCFTVCTSCWILTPNCTFFFCTPFGSHGLQTLHYISPSCRRCCPLRSIWNYVLEILHYNSSTTTPGRMHVDGGSWIPWLVSRIRSCCADKLGGGWERDKAQ